MQCGQRIEYQIGQTEERGAKCREDERGLVRAGMNQQVEDVARQREWTRENIPTVPPLEPSKVDAEPGQADHHQREHPSDPPSTGARDEPVHEIEGEKTQQQTRQDEWL